MAKRDMREYITGYIFLLPVFVLVGLFVLYPVLRTILLSFYEWPGFGKQKFVGLDNYVRLFAEDRYFWATMRHTVFFAGFTTAGTVSLGFLMALLVDLRFPMWKVYRFVFFLPVTFSAVAVGLIMARIVGPSGLFNSMAVQLGLDAFQADWLGRELALTTICLIIIWQFSGFTMIFFLAGLKNIPVELYDAALVDGASTFRRIVSITVPLLKHVFAVVLLVQLIFSFKAFAIFWIMTEGGPAGATEVLGTFVYRSGFGRGLLGYASSGAVVIIVIAVACSLVYATVLGYGPQNRRG
jgi:ABC-type sugar transport system permease subunit